VCSLRSNRLAPSLAARPDPELVRLDASPPDDLRVISGRGGTTGINASMLATSARASALVGPSAGGVGTGGKGAGGACRKASGGAGASSDSGCSCTWAGQGRAGGGMGSNQGHDWARAPDAAARGAQGLWEGSRHQNPMAILHVESLHPQPPTDARDKNSHTHHILLSSDLHKRALDDLGADGGRGVTDARGVLDPLQEDRAAAVQAVELAQDDGEGGLLEGGVEGQLVPPDQLRQGPVPEGKGRGRPRWSG
jgi:hypothetical protein